MKKKKTRTKVANQQESKSLGYPWIETLLEVQNPDLAPMKARHEQLKEMAKSAKLAKDKAAARQASVAYDRFFELYDQLAEIKKKMLAEQKPAPEKKR